MAKLSRGYTLLELLLVIIIATILSAGVFRVYKTADNARKVQTASTQILQVYQAAAQWNSNLPQTNDLIERFVQLGFLSSDFTSSSVNPWGGGIEAASNDGNGNKLTVTVDKVPEELCNNLYAKFKAIPNADPSNKCNGSFSVTFNLSIKE